MHGSGPSHASELIDMTSSNEILTITFPPNGLRARKIVTRSRARPTGKYPSWKLGRMAQWESSNELNAFQLLDANPAVIAYQEQPAVITYRLDGIVHKHVPDILVQYRHIRELWEVKPAAEAAHDDVAARTRLMEKSLPRLGFTYRMVLAENLAKNPSLSNVRTILRRGRRPVPPLAWEQIRQIFALHGAIPWGAVQDGILGRDGIRHTCRLILEGHLQVDLRAPLGRLTPITWCKKGAANGEAI